MKPRNFPGRKQARRERALARWMSTLFVYRNLELDYVKLGNDYQAACYNWSIAYASKQIAILKQKLGQRG